MQKPLLAAVFAGPMAGSVGNVRAPDPAIVPLWALTVCGEISLHKGEKPKRMETGLLCRGCEMYLKSYK